MPEGPPDLSAEDAPEALDHGMLHDLVGHLLRLSYNRAALAFRAEVTAGLTPLQMMTLELLSRNPGLGHAALAEGLGCAASVLTTALKGLLRAGLIVQGAGRDQRRRAYRLTDAGAARHALLRPRLEASEARLTAALSADEAATLRRILRRVAGVDGVSISRPKGD